MQCRMSIHRLRCGFSRWTDCHACLQCHFVRKSDMSSFMEDVGLIRPTELLMPPRITSMMHDRFQEMLAAKSAALPEQEQQQRQASPTYPLHALQTFFSGETAGSHAYRWPLAKTCWAPRHLRGKLAAERA